MCFDLMFPLRFMFSAFLWIMCKSARLFALEINSLVSILTTGAEREWKLMKTLGRKEIIYI